MKITKSKLAQIVKEELAAIKAEGYKAYKRDDMSSHAKELAKNRKKGYSPQAAVTAVPDNEEGEKRLHKSGLGPHSDKKPKRGLDESEQWQMGRSRKASDMYQLGRDDYGAFSAEEPTDDGVELDGERYPDDENYVKGWRDQQEEDAQDVEDDSWQRAPEHNYDDDSHEEVVDDDWMWENKITKSKLAQIVKEELAAVNLQEAPLPADEYEDTVEYLWSQNLSDIVLPFKHATSLDGEFPPAIETIVDYWEKKDFKGMASEWLDLRDELDDWLESRGFNWSIATEEDPGSRYVDYSIDGKKGRMPRNVIYTNFRHAFRLIRMLIDNPPAEGYDYRGFAGMSKSGVTSARYRQDTLGRRPQQERKITKSQLAQIIKEELKATLSESYALYDDLEDWVLEALVELGGEQPAGDSAGEIAAKAFEEWSLNAHNTEVGDEDPDHSVSAEVWSDSIDAALQSLVDDGRVTRLTHGGPGSTNEDFYVLAQ